MACHLTTTVLRQFQENDRPEILLLNAESVQVLSPMSSARFTELKEQCALLLVAEDDGAVCGFLLAFTAGAEYDSPNYRWFSDNVDGFLYIDRIVVSSKTRGLGIGNLLYLEARKWAVSNSLSKLTAEIDVEPPNHGSLMFHRKLGFLEMATQRVADTKLVSLQCLDIR